MSKETIIDAEKALIEKRERFNNPETNWKKRRRIRLKQAGICVDCGNKELTESEKAKGLVTCYKCRLKNRKSH